LLRIAAQGGSWARLDPTRIRHRKIWSTARSYPELTLFGSARDSPTALEAILPRRRSVRQSALDLLTLRERQVLKLLARGRKNAEAAGELVVGASTSGRTYRTC